MQNDPVVDEVHRIREELSAPFNFDVQAIFADMRTREAFVGTRLVAEKSGLPQPATSSLVPTNPSPVVH